MKNEKNNVKRSFKKEQNILEASAEYNKENINLNLIADQEKKSGSKQKKCANVHDKIFQKSKDL